MKVEMRPEVVQGLRSSFGRARSTFVEMVGMAVFLSLMVVTPKEGTLSILVHGIGIPADRPLRLGNWVRHTEHRYGELAVLDRWTVVLSDLDAISLAQSFEAASAAIGTGKETTTVAGGLIARPSIITEPGTVETPRTFLGRAERVSAWIRSDKRRFCHTVTRLLGIGENGEGELAKFLARLTAETGITFIGSDLARLGNFELIEPLTGSYSSDSVLDGGRFDHTDDGWRITIRLRPEVVGARVNTVHLRLRGGARTALGAIIYDRLLPYNGSDTIQILASEAPSRAEVTLYDDSGAMIETKSSDYIRGIGVALNDSDPISEGLPPELRGEFHQPMTGTSQALAAPWISAETEAEAIRAHTFPMPSPDFQTFTKAKEHRAFVAGFLLRRAGSGRAIIVDPYLDDSVLSAYLLRQQGRLQCDLTLVVSRHSGDAALHVMRAFCERNAFRLPNHFRIVNVPPREARPGGAFHDRFAIIGNGENLQVWHLGSSLNSYSKKYPLFAARAAGAARLAWAKYVEGLAIGDLGEHGHRTPVIVYEQHTAPPWQLTRPRVIFGVTRRIPGWSALLSTLAPRIMRRSYDGFMPRRRRVAVRERRAVQAVKALLRRGVLAENMPYEGQWLPGPRVEAVLSAVAASAQKNSRVLQAVAEWCAHGGLKPSEFSFSRDAVVRMVRIIEAETQASWYGPRVPVYLRLSPNAPFEKIFGHYARVLNQATPDVWGFRRKWFAVFIRDVALKSAPEALFDAMGRTRSQRLYDLLLAWRTYDNVSAYEVGLRHEDRGVAAVAILLLRDALPNWQLPPREKTSLDSFEYASALAILRADSGVPTDANALAALFDGISLDGPLISRIATIVDALPNIDEIVALDALAARRPTSEQLLLQERVTALWRDTLPLRGVWTPSTLRDVYAWRNDAVRSAVARQFVAMRDGENRLADLLARLDLGAANAPFLRVRNYALWHDLWQAIIESIHVGLLVIDSRHGNDLEHRVANLIRSLYPEITSIMAGDTGLVEMLRVARASASGDVCAALANVSNAQT